MTNLLNCLVGENWRNYGSTMAVPAELIGEISSDRSAIIGKNGWCFIYEGSNNYRGAYFDCSGVNVGLDWVRVIEKRSNIFAKEKIKFLQIVIPNKLSVLPDCFTERLDSDVSYALSALINSVPQGNFLMPLDRFRSSELSEYVFRRNDSHLTIVGNAVLFEMIIECIIGNVPSVKSIVCHESTHRGDLGGKFSPHLVEKLFVPVWSDGFFCLSELEKIKEITVNGFLGTTQIFINKNAMIDKKIVVFGNSFFEKVPSWGLSPFFAMLFSEFHFIWSPAVDVEYCVNIGADIVISQTCERFLSRLPVDKWCS